VRLLRRGWSFLATTSLKRKRFKVSLCFFLSFSSSVHETSLCHLLNEPHLKSLNFEVNYLSGCFSGEQVLEVLGVYVESSVLGYGGCCYNGNCTCQWRGELSKFSFGSF